MLLAGRRVTLFDRLGAIGIDLAALDDRHGAFVVTFECDSRIVRRPPVAGETIHLLLRDELCLAVMHGAAAVARELVRLAVAQVEHPQILLADVADVAAERRDLRVDRLAAGLEQAQRVAAVHAEIVQVQFAAKWKKQLFPIGRPVVVDDAMAPGDARAFAPRLLRIGQFRRLGLDNLGIDEHSRRVRSDVVFPQIERVLVVRLGAQERHARAVGRGLELDWGRPRQARAVEDALDSQLAGRYCSDAGRGHHDQ